jgi:hypothetical protein
MTTEHKISFLGDVYIGDCKNIVSSELKQYLKKMDCVVANLEGPITCTTCDKFDKGLNLKSSEYAIQELKNLKIKSVSLANNHIFDWGETGFNNTLTYLNKHSIGYFGAGVNLDCSLEPYIHKFGDVNIGLLSFGDKEVSVKSACQKVYGCAPLQEEFIANAIKKTREKTDIVVIQLHWGLTNYHYPLPEHRELAHKLIDKGADVIIGHHPHVIQGYEKYHSGHIIYSLGNFFFAPYYHNNRRVHLGKENYKGLIATIMVVGNKVVNIKFKHSSQIGIAGPLVLCDGEEEKKRNCFFGELSKGLENVNYNRFFRNYARRRLLRRIFLRLKLSSLRTLSIGHLKAFVISLKRSLS